MNGGNETPFPFSFIIKKSSIVKRPLRVFRVFAAFWTNLVEKTFANPRKSLVSHEITFANKQKQDFYNFLSYFLLSLT